MATRKTTKPPVEYPVALAALIERWQKKVPLPVEMLDTLAAEPSLQEWLVPEDITTDQDAWNGEFKAFYGWAATDLSDPMPSIAHLIQAKRKSTKQDFAKTPKGKRGTRSRERRTSEADMNAYCDALLAMPEHANCGWTFALRLMRILGGSADFKDFRPLFKEAQARAGVTSKRARKTVEDPLPPPEQPEPIPEADAPPKPRRSRAKKASAA